jgi:uncharacterized membrane protein YgaE (UPF0421/DUF939 family)
MDIENIFMNNIIEIIEIPKDKIYRLCKLEKSNITCRIDHDEYIINQKYHDYIESNLSFDELKIKKDRERIRNTNIIINEFNKNKSLVELKRLLNEENNINKDEIFLNIKNLLLSIIYE